MDISTLIIIAVLVVVVFYVISVYNRLVALRNRYQNGFAQIEVQLKRRYDLIPNLVETAKAYLSHERETLEAVIAARNGAVDGLKQASQNPGDAQSMNLLANAEGALKNAMGRLNVTVEAYPDLKASQNMQQLSEELSSTENKVAFARQAYNDAVTAYNAYRQSFPPVVLAGAFGHGSDAALLEFADSAAIQDAPKVAF
ncbi:MULTISPECIES: LemA family protein [Pseudomonas]|uniref:LemA family protein n=1 Tax=Pseudomonas fulva (strain 12-X) TaxID=743720 RepID=F6AJP0_PSEF1|nr:MULTISPECIES: LemA family protein [Pseudomonas]AEF22909.1 LemA family protein [Pseudomonas fulva 12-X]MBD9398120.1 LemA family protein [Pseudomonas sp. PDM11]PZW69773.1 LemA protein [Pseudomonas sp. URMO17WK12:I1]